MNQPDEFDRMMSQEYPVNSQQEFTDPTPYGPQTAYQAQQVKTGLTPRGKAAIGVGAAVIACGSLFGWQHYAAQQDANEVRAQQFAIQQQQIQLEIQKEINKANAAAKKTETAENSERNKLVDACVDSNKKMVGKLLGVTYQSVRGDCEDQYPVSTASTTGGDMQAAATATDATSSGDSGGINTALLIGGVVLAGGLFTAARKNTRSNEK
ncbi:hypothetical protein [Streptomyces violaceus]|uniref:LPXTG cell wall anchor domain-containing protein n=1 Tax=Streptomyces violaceus TaxID=1936 RepID=A0ABY9UP25_STRVL|nr:hypothetical protein [Streptomyces janthinus]WND24094.1 hypothetical protein RI060_43015 [Streptomyces janthinus]GGS96231.1 hypothetical protein GCM10010270_80240 [Streptomyces janthinus]